MLGAYGQPPAPIDPDVMDRILSTPRGRSLTGWERPDKTLEEVREEYGGRDLSDEELFRRHFAPVEDIEATRAAGPLKRDYLLRDSLSDLITQAMEYPGARHVRLSTPDLSVDLRR